MVRFASEVDLVDLFWCKSLAGIVQFYLGVGPTARFHISLGHRPRSENIFAPRAEGPLHRLVPNIRLIILNAVFIQQYPKFLLKSSRFVILLKSSRFVMFVLTINIVHKRI